VFLAFKTRNKMDGDDGAIILGGMDKHGSTNIFPIHVKKIYSRYSTGGASTVPTGYLVWARSGGRGSFAVLCSAAMQRESSIFHAA
jgi:hypothetical protein